MTLIDIIKSHCKEKNTKVEHIYIHVFIYDWDNCILTEYSRPEYKYCYSTTSASRFFTEFIFLKILLLYLAIGSKYNQTNPGGKCQQKITLRRNANSIPNSSGSIS